MESHSVAAVLSDATVRDLFDEAGCVGTFCAARLDGEGSVELEADRLVTPASVIKVPVALAAWRAIDAGQLDGTRRLALTAARRTPGPVGISLMRDDVEMSLRDLVSLMLTISDNPATDAVMGVVGLDAVNDLVRELGLTDTRMVHDLATMLDEMAREAGFVDYAALAAYEPSDRGDPSADDIRRRLGSTAALDPRRASSTTARDCVRLLRMIWSDRAAAPDACAEVRRAMTQQLTRHRIAVGFPPGYEVAVKSGGLMGVVRNEIGVVRDPEGTSYAVAAFTRTDPATRADHRKVDAAIGAAAAHAVGLLQG
jgi:beta-lactamase class A